MLKIRRSVRPSYLQHGNAYTGKTESLYWDGPQVPSVLVEGMRERVLASHQPVWYKRCFHHVLPWYLGIGKCVWTGCWTLLPHIKDKMIVAQQLTQLALVINTPCDQYKTTLYNGSNLFDIEKTFLTFCSLTYQWSCLWKYCIIRFMKLWCNHPHWYISCKTQ